MGLARVRLQEKGSWGQLKLSIRFQAYFLEKKGEGDVELVKKGAKHFYELLAAFKTY